MTRNVRVLQALTIVALVSAIFYVSHNFVRYILREDGGYSHWTVFSRCTKSCGTGVRFRTRSCNNPEPQFGGKNCSVLGEDKQTFMCNMNPCPVDGAYGPWSDFGECSVTCGEGVQQRRRQCDNPEPKFGGLSCEKLELGSDVESRVCNKGTCPVNGGYGKWSDFGECSVTCGGGMRERNRQCNSPEPQFGGKTCEEQDLGPSVETEACNEQSCPVDGNYSEWTEFGKCTVTCGGGVRQRTRECTNPAPDNGGQSCERLGPAMESEQCNVEPCPTKAAENQGKVSDNGDEKNKDDRKEKRDAEESEKPQEIKEGIIENDENKRDQEEDGNKEKKEEENGEDAKEKSR